MVYLLRQAANSFIRHGRRPGGPHFGYYQVGQLFDWKFEIYADEDRIHPWLKTYYDHWITATNALWFAGWMDPQTITKFFRWGSLVRYLYL